jgi:hypothetical protein
MKYEGFKQECYMNDTDTHADVVQEERERCEEIINALVQRCDSFRAKN